MESQIPNEAPEGDTMPTQPEGSAVSQNHPFQPDLEAIREELGQTKLERASLRIRLEKVREDLNKNTAENEFHPPQLASTSEPNDTVITWDDQQQLEDLVQERDASLFRIKELEARISRFENGSELELEGLLITAPPHQEADDLYYQIHGVGGYEEQIDYLQNQVDAHEPNAEADQVNELRQELEEITAERNLLLIQLYSDERVPQIPDFHAEFHGTEPAQQQEEQDNPGENLVQKYQEEIGQLQSSRSELLDQFLDLQRELAEEQEQSADLREQTKLEMLVYSDSLHLCTEERDRLQEDLVQLATAITEMEAERARQVDIHAYEIGEKDNMIAALQLESMTGPDRYVREHAREIMEKDAIIAAFESELGGKQEGHARDEIGKRDEATANPESELESERTRFMELIENQQVEVNQQVQLLKQLEDTSTELGELREKHLVITNDHQHALAEVEMIQKTCEKLETTNQKLHTQLGEKDDEIVGLQSKFHGGFSKNPPLSSLRELDKNGAQFEQEEELLCELDSAREQAELATQQAEQVENLYQDALQEQQEQLEQHEAVVRSLRYERDQHKKTTTQRDELKDQNQAIVHKLESAESQLAATREEFSLYKGRRSEIINELQQRLATGRAEQLELRDQIVALGGRIDGHLLMLGKPSGHTNTAARNGQLQKGAHLMGPGQDRMCREGSSQTDDFDDTQQLGNNARHLKELHGQIEYLSGTNISLLRRVSAKTAKSLNDNNAFLASELQQLQAVLQHHATESKHLDLNQILDILHYAIEQLIDQFRMLSQPASRPRPKRPRQPSIDAKKMDTDEEFSPTRSDPESSHSLYEEPNEDQQMGQDKQPEQLLSTSMEHAPSSKRARRSGTRSTRNQNPVYTWPPSHVISGRVSKKKDPKKKV